MTIENYIPDTIFYVDAVLLQLDRGETYGPFPGRPTLTYEFVREDELGEHLFIYNEGLTELPPCPLDPVTCNEQRHPDHWHREDDGLAVAFGWRRCGNQMNRDPQGRGGGSFGVPMDSEFWSDLGFRIEPNTDGLRFTHIFNDLPKVATNPVTTHENWGD